MVIYIRTRLNEEFDDRIYFLHSLFQRLYTTRTVYDLEDIHAQIFNRVGWAKTIKEIYPIKVER